MKLKILVFEHSSPNPRHQSLTQMLLDLKLGNFENCQIWVTSFMKHPFCVSSIIFFARCKVWRLITKWWWTWKMNTAWGWKNNQHVCGSNPVQAKTMQIWSSWFYFDSSVFLYKIVNIWCIVDLLSIFCHSYFNFLVWFNLRGVMA